MFGGPPVTLGESPNAIYGASWGADDQIIFGTNGAGLFRISGGGGEPEALTMLDVDQGEVGHYWPFIIPDRQAVPPATGRVDKVARPGNRAVNGVVPPDLTKSVIDS